VVVLREGRIEQVGTPLELYDRPASRFVAQFIGTPQMNVVPAAGVPQLQAAIGARLPGDGAVGLRPESVALKAPGHGQFDGRVELVEALGAETLIYLSTGGGAQLTARQSTRTALRAGDSVGVELDVSAAHLFDGQGHAIPAAAMH
jgi:multiple sugar transport system ATP-binding protein